MKIIVFCDAIGRIAEFRNRFAEAGSSDVLVFMVCNNTGRNLLFHFAIQLRHALRRYRLADWLAFVRDLWAGRILMATGPLGSPATLAFLDRQRPALALHAMGVIYRDEVIERCGLGILNAHIGQLPKYRGRSVMEWSLLCGDSTGVTVFFIDSGIDTGHRIVLFEPIEVAAFDSLDQAKRHLFSRDVDLYVRAVDRIRSGAALEHNDVSQGFRFYQMSALLHETLDRARQSRGGADEGAARASVSPGQRLGAV